MFVMGTHYKYFSEVLLMGTTTYVFVRHFQLQHVFIEEKQKYLSEYHSYLKLWGMP